MTRVQFRLLILSVFALLQGCSSIATKPEGSAGLAKIIHFSDAMGAVHIGDSKSTPEDARLRSMLAAFDQCELSHQLAFVTPPIEFSPQADYVLISSYSLQHGRFLADSVKSKTPSYVAPFECIDQKHGVESAILESREVPSTALHTQLSDEKGALKALAVEPNITGLKNGDLILAIGEKRVETRTELAKIVDWLAVGPTKYTVIRANSVIQVDGEITDHTPATLTTAKVLLSEICTRLKATSKTCQPAAAAVATIQ